MKEYLPLLIWAAVIAVVFVFLWRKGYLARLANFIQETREELKKCTWPTWDELKGSTVVVIISILILGGYTIIVDTVLFQLVRAILRS